MRPSRKSRKVNRQSRFEQFEQRLALSGQPIGDFFLGNGLEQRLEHHYGELTPAEPVAPINAAGDFLLGSELEQRVQPQVGDLTAQLADVHDMTGVNYVHNTFGFDGAGQTVAIIDSGIAYDHYALGGGFGSGYRVVGGYDFAENDADPFDEGPAGFHGTHVAGIVGSSNSTFRGVASGSDLVALRVFDDNGAGLFSWVESALQWVHDHRNDYQNPITAANLSLGATWNADSVPGWAMLEDEFAQLKADGIFISVSAGNSFTDYNAPGVSYPAASSYVVPVSSVDNNGLMSYFSQRNSSVLAAPGRSITSTVPDHVFGADGIPNDFGTASGTSMAAPYVAGASALVRQAMEFVGYQSITQDTIYDHLRSTADMFYDAATDANYHRINVQAALDTLMPDDDYGSSAGAAHSIGTISGDMSFAGVIGTLDDSDYFSFTAGTTGTASFSADVTYALAPAWQLVGGGGQVSGASNEIISFDVTQGQTYTLGLASTNGLGHYTINVETQSTGPVLTTSGTPLVYNENDPASAIDSGLQLVAGSGGGSGELSATVQIIQNYQAAQDLLSYSDSAKILGSSANGTLTLRVADGQTASLADFQAALRSVTYRNTSEDPSTTTRTVEFAFSDGNQTTAATAEIDVVAANDAPLLTTSSTSLLYTENDAATPIDPTLNITDVDNQNPSSNFQATVHISANYAAGQDVLSFTNTNKIAGDLSGNTLTLTVVAGQQATLADFRAALRSVTYHNTSEDPATATRTVAFAFSDGSQTAVATREIDVVSVEETVQIIDNGAAGFTTSGSWTRYPGQGREGDIHYSAAGNGSSVASWTFNVSAGVYRVSSTWFTHSNRATDAPYTVLDGNQSVGQMDVNQEELTTDLFDEGSAWQDLGQFTITGDTLVVQLSDQANQYVIADAVRIERVADIVLAPEVQLLNGTTNVSDNGSVSFGSTQPGVAVDKVLTVKNVGTQNLMLTPLGSGSLPTGFSLLQNFGSTNLAPGAATTFTLRMQSGREGSLSGSISFANNDSDEGSFDLNLLGTVASAPPAPAVQIIDNGAAGFTTSGSWTRYLGQGREGDIHYSAAGNGSSVASWSFNVSAGVYRVSSTWYTLSNRATDAPYTVLDGNQAVGQMDVNQEGLTTHVFDEGSAWQDLGQFTVTGNTLVVQLSDQANQYVIADAVRIERVADIVLAPEIQLLNGTTNVGDNGSVSFGSTQPGVAVDKVLTVKNVGTQNLTLTPLDGGSFPTGFSLLQNFGSTNLAAGASTTFTLRMQSGSEGSLSGSISFANNDSDEGSFDLNLQGTVASAPPAPAVQIIDNGAAGFTTSGSWTRYPGQGREGDIHYSAAGNGSSVASWSFNVSAGVYRVSSTWYTLSNRATDAPYTVLDGNQVVGQMDVNQEGLTTHLIDEGSAWQDLGQFTVTGDTLVVQLSDQANQYVIADAVRIERVADIVLAPEIQLLNGTTNVSDNGSVSFGSTQPGVAVDKVLTVKNVGTQNLTLTPLDGGSFPTGFSLLQNFGSTNLAAGASTTFTLRMQSGSEGSLSGSISFANNDSDEGSFDLNLQGTVASAPPAPAVQIIDNGAAGFTTSGSWTRYMGQGREEDIHYSAAGNGSSVASWTFNVSAGVYRVSSTWFTLSNRATDAPFTILDGNQVIGQMDVNQEGLTTHLIDAGSAWQDLGQFTVTGDTLVVQLSDQANQYVIADAVRIEMVAGPQNFAAESSGASPGENAAFASHNPAWTASGRAALADYGQPLGLASGQAFVLGSSFRTGITTATTQRIVGVDLRHEAHHELSSGTGIGEDGWDAHDEVFRREDGQEGDGQAGQHGDRDPTLDGEEWFGPASRHRELSAVDLLFDEFGIHESVD